MDKLAGNLNSVLSHNITIMIFQPRVNEIFQQLSKQKSKGETTNALIPFDGIFFFLLNIKGWGRAMGLSFYSTKRRRDHGLWSGVFQHQCAAMVAQMLAHTKDYTECEDRLRRALGERC